MCLSREGRDLGVAFQAPPGSQASSRGEAKDSALLSSRDAGLKNLPAMQDTWVQYLGWEDPLVPGSSVVKNLPANAGDIKDRVQSLLWELRSYMLCDTGGPPSKN